MQSLLVPFVSLFGTFVLSIFVCEYFWRPLLQKREPRQLDQGRGKRGESHTDIWLLINSELAAKVYTLSICGGLLNVNYVICTMYYVLCTMYYVLCIMYYVLCTMYYVLCTMYCVLCTMLYVLCTMYDVLCTMYDVICTI